LTTYNVNVPKCGETIQICENFHFDIYSLNYKKFDILPQKRRGVYKNLSSDEKS